MHLVIINVNNFRNMVNQLNNIRMLGDAQDFLEAFKWTDNALRDLEAVNINRMHTMGCGIQNLVKLLISYVMTIAIICDQICQKGSYTHTISKLIFCHHSIPTSMH